MNRSCIQLRGARLHNLKGVDVDIPLGKFVVVCGVSGSGKTSLAVDTLYAEGQRRFVECFSSYARQFLQRIEKPEFDLLENLPPTTAVQRPTISIGSRLTVGSQTEVIDYLRLLMAKAGELHCIACDQPIVAHSPQTIARFILKLSRERKVMICFPLRWESRADISSQLSELQSLGFFRILVSDRTFHLAQDSRSDLSDAIALNGEGWVVVDRINGGSDETRTVQSIESAFNQSPLRIALLLSTDDKNPGAIHQQVDGKAFDVEWFGRDRRCSRCGTEYPAPEPSLFQTSSSMGACKGCNGLGYCDNPDRIPCPICKGTRLQQPSLAYRFGGLNFYQLSTLEVHKLQKHLEGQVQALQELDMHSDQTRRRNIAFDLVQDLSRRLHFLTRVGIGHLTLNRFGNTLSSGELQRVSLTVAMGSSLTNMMYVVDEPTSGVHPTESAVVIKAIAELRDRGNTVIGITHDRRLIDAADWVIEMGPLAGDQGGQVLYCGDAATWRRTSTLTTDYLSQRRGKFLKHSKRRVPNGMIRITGATGNNLKNIDVDFPIGLLCVVTGVSGSGKSTLVESTFYQALDRIVGRHRVTSLPYESLTGFESLDDVVLINQDPIAKSTRSIPATYLKILDDIRLVFAETPEARSRNMGSEHFSFNHTAGQCEACKGTGCQEVDMQFLADIRIPCVECHGYRYSPQSLEIKYRDRSIGELLRMTAEQAHGYFRGHAKIQHRLQMMIDVGLHYLQLGQTGNQLSQGETQRLKLASYFGATSKRKTLFVLDEPTNGLHFNDVVKLIDCFAKLIERGHSLVAIDHHDQLIMAADYLIELGPGASQEGGSVVAIGTPEELMDNPNSITGKFLTSLVVSSELTP